MTPEQVSVINTIALILERVGTLPIGGLLAAVVLGPWVAFLLILKFQEKERRQERGEDRERFEAVAQMYKDNAELAKSYRDMATGLQEMVVWCTQTMTGVKDIAENNLFCPIVKKGSKQKEVDAP